jgi:hypothetical protein
MQTFAQLALPATIVASALGAVVLCVVLLLYGFKNEPDDDRSPAARLLVIRLGHAVAAGCFAAALMFSTVALTEQRRVIAEAAAPRPAPASAERLHQLAAHVDTLAQRLAAAELRLGDVETARLAAAPGAVAPPVPEVRRVSRAPKVASVPARLAPAATTSEASAAPPREPVEAAGVRRASSVPMAASATGDPSRDDFGATVRENWQAMKEGFRQAGRDIHAGFADFGRRIKHTFN